ncbi:FAD binding domain-containing protein [Apiospora kogelbergensis]|uniref:FAD binding domain-containing protein n=1 Tax=Apiospora kogelbergensis TaxID=1337665 RepID=A0AAW0R2R3_9PEZI
MLWQRQPPSRSGGTDWAKQSGDGQAPPGEYETCRILSVGDRVSFHVPVGLAASASASYTYDTVIDTTSIQVNKCFSVDCTNALQPLWIPFPNEASIGGRRPGNRPCGNVFGIVVAYALLVYPQGEVWGGNCTSNAAEQNDKLRAAAQDFVEHDLDEKADTTLSAEIAMGGLLTPEFSSSTTAARARHRHLQ